MFDSSNNNVKNFLKISFGNLIEWYDFAIYGIFALPISRVFFSNLSVHKGLLLTFLTFAVGFITRPLGGLIFGMLGDKFGRKFSINLSIWLMAIPTILIGFLPGYDQIGVFASISLIVLRILQGISVGGQFSGLLVVTTENTTKYQPFLVSLVYAVSVVGSLVAAVVGLILTKLPSDTNINWFDPNQTWRYAFLLSAVIFLIYVRLNAKFHYEPTDKPKSVHFSLIFKAQPIEFISLMLFSASNGSIYFILFSYFVTYMQVYMKIDTNIAFIIQNLMLILSIVLYLLFGYIASTKANYIKQTYKVIVVMLIALIALYLDSLTVPFELALFFLLVACVCAITSFMISNFSQIFDDKYRMTAFSLSFNLGAVIAGFAPFIVEMVNHHAKQGIWGVITAMLMIIFISWSMVIRLKPKNLVDVKAKRDIKK